MPLYQLHYKANPTLWPSDPKENLEMWEESTHAAEALLESGSLHDLHLVTPTEGYARLTAESKTTALAIAASFFPMFTNEIVELIPLERGEDPGSWRGASSGRPRITLNKKRAAILPFFRLQTVSAND